MIDYKTLPRSRIAEETVLGAILKDGKNFEKVKGTLKPSDFYYRFHRELYRAFEYFVDEGLFISLGNISVHLRDRDIIVSGVNDGWPENICEGVPDGDGKNIEAYADIVRERSILRQLIESTQEILEENGIDMTPLRTAIMDTLSSMTSNKSTTEDDKVSIDAIDAALDTIVRIFEQGKHGKYTMNRIASLVNRKLDELEGK